MVLKASSSLLVLVIILSFSSSLAVSKNHNLDLNDTSMASIELPDHLSFNYVSSSASTSGCNLPTTSSSDEQRKEVFGTSNPHQQPVKFHLRRRSMSHEETNPEKSVLDFTLRDLSRIQTLHTRVIEKKNQNTISRLRSNEKQKRQSSYYKPVIAPAASPDQSYPNGFPTQLVATLESGVTLGSGEYLIDVFIGTPPKHFSLILDTGSDLNWIQCVPCYACFEQNGPFYDPKGSSSFRNISCHDPRCQLVSSPDPPHPCKSHENQTCPYFYWYGDSSNTTGDFALETFTVNLTLRDGRTDFRRLEEVMFGCGHWNRGLFHGAAGLLGLGRGPLSFASQLQSLFGHSFSYCLVDRNSDTSVSSKLIFGEDKDLLNHPNLNFTSFVGGEENLVDTFYYVQIKSIMVGGAKLEIPEGTWHLSREGSGGTIIDSGTTLTYFAHPAYEIIKEAFVKKIKGYHRVEGFPPLNPCYNVSGVEKMEVPDFGIEFADGAVWNFPEENYFIQIEPDVVCLAILRTPRSNLSIIGNYQQQNFHVLYDIKNSRLGYEPKRCADA